MVKFVIVGHGDIALDVSRAGKHLMLGKPIATSVGDADLIIDECRRNGTLLSVAYCYRLRPDVLYTREPVKAGAIGRIIAVTSCHVSSGPENCWSGGYSGRVQTDWRPSLAQSGGGTFLMDASHTIDFFLFISGLRLTRVYAESGNMATAGIEVEDTISASIRLDNGAIGHFGHGSASFRDGHAEDTVQGERGTTRLGNPTRVLLVGRHRDLEPGTWNVISHQESGDPWFGSRVRYIEDFCTAVLTGSEIPVSGESARDVLAIAKAAYMSSETKRAAVPRRQANG